MRNDIIRKIVLAILHEKLLEPERIVGSLVFVRQYFSDRPPEMSAGRLVDFQNMPGADFINIGQAFGDKIRLNRFSAPVYSFKSYEKPWVRIDSHTINLPSNSSFPSNASRSRRPLTYTK